MRKSKKAKRTRKAKNAIVNHGKLKKKPSSLGLQEHYLRVKFSKTKDNRPEVYDFLYYYLPKILARLNQKQVGLKIERLEPLDRVYTNLNLPEAEIRKRLVDFALHHALHKDETFLFAVIPVSKLSKTLKDYDLLFDLFFTDLVVASKDLKLDMMDGFFNTLLAIGSKEKLEKLKELTERHAKFPVSFKFVDHKESREG